jgi:hypothetical protein
VTNSTQDAQDLAQALERVAYALERITTDLDALCEQYGVMLPLCEPKPPKTLDNSLFSIN